MSPVTISGGVPQFQGTKAQPFKQAAAAPRFSGGTDRVHFGNGDGSTSTTNPAPKENFWRENSIGKRATALAYGIWDGAWGKNKSWDVGYTTAVTLLTLPFALLIPGSHLLMIPGTFATLRGIRTAANVFSAITNPDSILKEHPPKTKS